MPQHEIEVIVKFILPKIQEFYGSKEGKRGFEEWKQKQEMK